MTCACTPTPRPARRSTSTRCSTACPSATTSTSAAPGPCSTRCSGAPARARGSPPPSFSGPGALLDAMLGRARARGWEPDRVHWEIFAAPAAAEGDQPFEVELARSGQRFTVPAGQSILDCLIENGCDPMFDCKRGACGVCAVPVLEGGIDHRDHVLSAREKAQGSVMQICISRVKGTRLVLDI